MVELGHLGYKTKLGIWLGASLPSSCEGRNGCVPHWSKAAETQVHTLWRQAASIAEPPFRGSSTPVHRGPEVS